MVKLATRVALVLIVVCSLGVMLAPAAIAGPRDTNKTYDVWAIRLDTPSTKQLAVTKDPVREVSTLVLPYEAVLPKQILTATFALWLSAYLAERAQQDSRAGCVELDITADGRLLNWETHDHCPWRVSSVNREKVTVGEYGWTAYAPID
ncbi:hypothetical protein GOEFS_077_00520 [Gordonia effusa NBRC 100432]|uniref:Uncharacterized protein n=1 Tax=Gordonia effusa NBRC 100432 TaxID=1077974 RepID=H0R2F9_9ACTN|nr:hypothetical protein GOEFS_077_00520 [Gordonia effusa NBRC 100432]